jgi:hypothetical protein
MVRKATAAATASSESPVINHMIATRNPDPKVHGSIHDHEFSDWMARMAKTVDDALKKGDKTVVRTSAGGLFELFLANLPASERQYHRCMCCEKFFKDYGNLAMLEGNGSITPLLTMVSMAAVPAKYKQGMSLINRLVSDARITGPFFPDVKMLGNARTGKWTHFYLTMPSKARYMGQVKSAYEAEAEKKEDFKNISRAIGEFTMPILEDVLKILNSNAAFRGEQIVAQAEWLKTLKGALVHKKTIVAREKVIWYAVINAPAGFLHPRSGVLGSIIEDLEKGLSYADVAKKFSSKMDPSKYQRSEAAPSAQTVKRAEEIVAKLGAEGAFRRRFALVHEVPLLWSPRPRKPKATLSVPASSVFKGVKTKEVPKTVSYFMPAENEILKGGKMSWEKFQQKVLPSAEKIVLLTSGVAYGCIVAPVKIGGPAILQWDLPEKRNQYSWYTYPGAMSAGDWSLGAGRWVDVTGITLKPNMWNDNTSGQATHHGKSVFFLLKGCKDARTPGLCLFPEILKSDFHEVRSAIEGLNKSKTLEPMFGEHAAGAFLSDTKDWAARVRVWANGAVTEYTLDRWE